MGRSLARAPNRMKGARSGLSRYHEGQNISVVEEASVGSKTGTDLIFYVQVTWGQMHSRRLNTHHVGNDKPWAAMDGIRCELSTYYVSYKLRAANA